MNKKPFLWKAIFDGLRTGALGSILGFIPMFFLHNYLNEYAQHLEPGSLLWYLLLGYPLHIYAILFLPVAGAVVGMLAALIGYARKSTRPWLWGWLAGMLINLFVSFWAAM